MFKERGQIVYVVGAGFSAGLGFPTIKDLMRKIWPRLIENGISDEIADIIRFHHPSFNPDNESTFVNVEKILSEMQANEELFEYSRPATGGFSVEELVKRRRDFLFLMAQWFHELQRTELDNPSPWIRALSSHMIHERAQIISFNWDLVLDEILFGDSLSKKNYGFAGLGAGPRLLKPHGSLNWFENSTGKHLKEEKKFHLLGRGKDAVYAFKPFRAPISSRRVYLPLIVPPVFNKNFGAKIFQMLWREIVSVLSSASEVRFLGFSLADADFHARFILRCGFHNQENGELLADGSRSSPTGRAAVSVVDLDHNAHSRIQEMVGWPVDFAESTIEDWVMNDLLGSDS